jgi:sulfur carrier protein
MVVTVIKGENKKKLDINGNKTVKDLLELLDVPSETVVVKKNDFIVIDEEQVQDGDTLEIIQVIYGG